MIAAIRAERAKAWRLENAGAIVDYNAFIDETGVPLAQYRKFQEVAAQFDLYRMPGGQWAA